MPIPKGIQPPPPDREAVCPYFSVCGGCESQDVSYSEQTAFKDRWLRGLFGAFPGNEALWQPFLAAAEDYPLYFRNKIRFGFLDTGEGIAVSRHAKGNEDADVPVDRCFLQSPLAEAIALFTAEFATRHGWKPYRASDGSGWLKHILIREGKRTGEALVSLVTTETAIPDGEGWMAGLRERFPAVRSLYQTRTQGKNNEHSRDILLWGNERIRETVGDKEFFISPHAFFQTNGEMVKALYDATAQAAGLTGSESVWDLYAGSATIGIYVSGQAGRVISIESNPQNVADARLNVEANGVTNLAVYEGSVEAVCTSPFIHEHGRPDVAIVDPPRAGLSEPARNLLANLRPKRIVYVSCNPATCRRDCEELVRRGFRLTSLRGADMFPHTYHCEMIVTLEA